MPSSFIKIGDRDIELKVNAYSIIIYEDEFKGRRFLKDFETILCGEPEISNHIRFTWTLAKTANPELEEFMEFSNNCDLGDVLNIVNKIVDLVNQSLSTGNEKNSIAAAQ